MTRDQIGYLWNLIAQAWGQKFAEQYGPEPNAAWLAALEHMTPDAARHAYTVALRESPTFPPTLPEFLGWANTYRPPEATQKFLPSGGGDVPTESLRQAASAEVAEFRTYADYERWRASHTSRGKAPAHPSYGSADWMYLRRLAFEQATRGRPVDRIAAGAAADDERATRAYEALDPETGLHAHLSPALLALRERDPERFEAISREARRLQALGRPRSADLAGATRAMPR